MLAKIHSRRTAYKLMVLSVLALEAFFGWRASLMYESVLKNEVGPIELQVIKWLVFVAIWVFGFVLSTHRQFGIEAIYDRVAARGLAQADQDTETNRAVRYIKLAVLVVVVHDLAGTLYTIFQPGHPVTFGPVAMAVGACALVFIPFLVGHMALALAESGPREMQEDVQQTILTYQHKLHLSALKRLYKHASNLEPEEILSGGIAGLPALSAPTEDGSIDHTASAKTLFTRVLPMPGQEGGQNASRPFRILSSSPGNEAVSTGAAQS
ncbi:MAG TPA: hypothetical protein VKT82_33195 [Ktedonobacterales bacterium]|nr:hypothetical protein [Ktedonobacterales bacterium]